MSSINKSFFIGESFRFREIGQDQLDDRIGLAVASTDEGFIILRLPDGSHVQHHATRLVQVPANPATTDMSAYLLALEPVLLGHAYIYPSYDHFGERTPE